jgi:hypothetical protein
LRPWPGGLLTEALLLLVLLLVVEVLKNSCWPIWHGIEPWCRLASPLLLIST